MTEQAPYDTDSAGGPVDSQPQESSIQTTVDTVVAAGQMLADPRKCQIWHESWLTDGLTIKGLTDATSIPQSTIYDLSREMVKEGSLYAAGSTDNNATILKPTPMQVFVSAHPENVGQQFNIHSTLIGVVGRGVDSDDIQTFLERNNYTLLVKSITGVLRVLSGDEPDVESLDEVFEWMDPVDAQLIQGHIAAVLKREAQKPQIEWEFPAEPAISPTE